MSYESDPARKGVAITTSDTVSIASGTTRGIYVGGAGNLVCLFKDHDTVVTIVGAVAGTVLPFEVVRVNATSTTATSLVALY
jgi:hypothetical protein